MTAKIFCPTVTESRPISVSVLGTRRAIERVKRRPNSGLTILETIIVSAIARDDALTRDEKFELLSDPWKAPARRSTVG